LAELAGELMARADADGVSLVGPGGLLAGLTKTVLESALEAEMTEHLGYEAHDPAGHHSGNSRNGTRTKTVLTDIGPVDLDVPRDRAGSFEPVIVPKRVRRLGGVDAMVCSLSAKGLTHGEISAHLGEIYGARVSKETVTRITDRVMEGMTAWQNRPLDQACSPPPTTAPRSATHGASRTLMPPTATRVWRPPATSPPAGEAAGCGSAKKEPSSSARP